MLESLRIFPRHGEHLGSSVKGLKFRRPRADTRSMDTHLRPAPHRPAPPAPSAASLATRAEEFVAWAAEVDDDTWRSLRIRVENRRFQLRREASEAR